MSYDAVNRVTVLYSGNVSGTSFPDDTWTYNGTDWTQKSPTHTPGTLSGTSHGRVAHKMCSDPISGGLLMAGGFINGATTDNLVYHWSGTDWTSTTPAHPIADLAEHGQVNNGTNVVVFGNSNHPDGNSYAWSGGDWVTYLNDGGNPIPRQQFDPSYDTAAAAIVVFGGRQQTSPSTYLSDLWTLLSPGPSRVGGFTLYHPTSYDSTESNGVTQLVNAFNVNGLSASIGPFFGLPASGMYTTAITPDGLFGIIVELQVNSVSTPGHCWVFPLSNPANYTQITLSSTQARGVWIVPGASGHWYALVCGTGTWIVGYAAAGSVDVVDMSASPPAIIKTVSSSGVWPVFVGVTSNAAKAIVVDGGTTGHSMRIYTIDLTGPVSGWALSAGPTLSGTIYNMQDLLLSPDNSYAWISDAGASFGGSNVVRPLNLSTMTFATPIACSVEPGPMAMKPDSSKIWLGCSSSSTLLRIDTASKTIDHTTTYTATAGSGGSTYPVTMSPDGSTLYWAEGGPPGHLWAMDTTTLAPTDTGVQIPGFGSYVASPLSVSPLHATSNFLMFMGGGR